MNDNDDITLHRAALAVHVGTCQTLGEILGPTAGMTLATLWNCGSPPELYGQELRSRAAALLTAFPEIADELFDVDGIKTAAQLVYVFNLETIGVGGLARELPKAREIAKELETDLNHLLQGIDGDGKTPLGEELETDTETVAWEQWRLRKAIPQSELGLHPSEMLKLERALGISLSDRGDSEGSTDQYAQTILTLLLDTTSFHEMLTDKAKTGLRRKNSRLWQWAGIPKPGPHETPEPDTVCQGIANIFQKLSTLGGRREIASYLVGVSLRRTYGLNKGKKTDTFSELEERHFATAEQAGTESSEPWEPEDADSARGYEDVDTWMVLEAIWDTAPPAQREALEIYLEADLSGLSVAEVCRARGEDPNVVRNNLRALSRKYRPKAS